MHQLANRKSFPIRLAITIVVGAAGLSSACSTFTQDEEPIPKSTLTDQFNPCRDVSTELRQRNGLSEPELADVYYRGHPIPSTREVVGCSYSSIEDGGDAYGMIVAVSSSFTAKKPSYQVEEFEGIQIAGRTGEIGCVAGDAHPIPYCDIKVQLEDTQVWFNLRYDYPRESIAASEAVTRAKVTELATQIVAEIPPDR